MGWDYIIKQVLSHKHRFTDPREHNKQGRRKRSTASTCATMATIKAGNVVHRIRFGWAGWMFLVAPSVDRHKNSTRSPSLSLCSQWPCPRSTQLLTYSHRLLRNLHLHRVFESTPLSRDLLLRLTFLLVGPLLEARLYSRAHTDRHVTDITAFGPIRYTTTR